MTNKQAKDILEHLTNELVRNGYGEVVRLVNIRMEAAVDELNPNISYGEDRYKFQLRIFLRHAGEVLENLSSHSVAGTIARLNEHLSDSDKLTEIYVEMASGEEIALGSLPDYGPVIQMIRSLREEIKD